MNIQYLPPSSLTPYEFNNKKHPKEQIDLLINSIKDFGFTQPVVVDQDNVIIIGHARTKAAQILKLEKIPVVVREDLDPIAIKKLRILDNKLSDLAERDKENLKLELEEIGDEELTSLFDDLDICSPESGITAMANNLSKKFGVPPFSILDTRQGYRQERKKELLKLTGDLEETREDTLFKYGDSAIGKELAKIGTTSHFDPVLAEIMYKRFCPVGGRILDPFGGEQTKGVIAGFLGYKYTAVEFRQEQVDVNNRHTYQYQDVKYYCGDSNNLSKIVNESDFDFVFTSPPYYDLEVYSAEDMSALGSYEEFMAQYKNIFQQCYDKLKDNRFLVVKIGEIRNKKSGIYRNFVGDNIKIFTEIGFKYYNEIVLINAIGTLPLRAGKVFDYARKIGKCHQNILVFYKGDETFQALDETFHQHKEVTAYHDNILVFYKGDEKKIKDNFNTAEYDINLSDIDENADTVYES